VAPLRVDPRLSTVNRSGVAPPRLVGEIRRDAEFQHFGDAERAGLHAYGIFADHDRAAIAQDDAAGD
jgi:hypothetical protein